MRKKLCLLLTILFCGALCTIPVRAETSPYLIGENWNNLSGYTYVGKVDSGAKNPAQVTFDESGIHYRSKGFYKVGVREYSGLLFREKVDVSDFYVDIRIDKLGGSSNNNDDAWIAVGFLNEEKGFDSIAPDYNKGALTLLRPSNRSMTAFVHENTIDGKVVHKFDDTISAQGYLPFKRVEGSTVRIRFLKKISGYEISVQDVGTEGTKPIVLTGSLYYPETYLSGDKGYLFLSTSTDSGNQWNVTVKNIDGMPFGSDETVEKLTPDQEVTKLFELLSKADLKNKVENNTLTLADEDLVYKFTELVEMMSAEAKMILNSDPDVAAEYGSGDALLKELSSLLSRAGEKIAGFIATESVAELESSLDVLPEASAISGEHADLLLAAEQNYRNLSERAKQLLQERYADIGINLAKLRASLNRKLADEVSVILSTLSPSITAENIESDLYSLRLAKAKFEALSDESKTLVTGTELFESKAAQFKTYKNGLDIAEKKLFESLERLAEVNVLIEMLPVRAMIRLEDESAVQKARTEYFGLSSEAKGKVKRLGKLEDAEAELASIRISLIPAIDAVTLVYEDVIIAARNAYAGLDLGAKQKVSQADVDKLNASYEKLQKLLNPSEGDGEEGDPSEDKKKNGCGAQNAGKLGGMLLLVGIAALDLRRYTCK